MCLKVEIYASIFMKIKHLKILGEKRSGLEKCPLFLSSASEEVVNQHHSIIRVCNACTRDTNLFLQPYHLETVYKHFLDGNQPEVFFNHISRDPSTVAFNDFSPSWFWLWIKANCISCTVKSLKMVAIFVPRLEACFQWRLSRTSIQNSVAHVPSSTFLIWKMISISNELIWAVICQSEQIHWFKYSIKVELLVNSKSLR